MPTWPVAAFRIVFAVVALRDVAALWAHVDFLWPAGWDPHPWTPSRLLLLPWAVALVLTMVGLWTRAAAVVNLAATIVVLGPAKSVSTYWQTADTMLFLGAWLLLLLPTDSCWALSRRRRAPSVPAFAHAAAGAILCTIYVDSGLRKLLSPMWRSGLGIWAPASLPEAVLGRVPGLDVAWFMQLLGFGTIVWELSFVVAWFLLQRLRLIVWSIGIAFHVGGLIYFPFYTFSLTMLALHILATPPELARRIGRQGAKAEGGAHPWLPKPVVLVALAGWLVAHALMLIDLGAPPGSKRTRLAAIPTRAYPLTGMQIYGVFDDSLFNGQDYQVDVVWLSDSSCTVLPAHSAVGFNSRSLTDRRWERWFKRSQAPRTALDFSESEFIHWMETAEQDKLPARTATIIARYQFSSPTQWRRGLLARNLDEPWKKVGNIQKSGTGELTVQWITRDRRSTLGEQVAASLAEALPEAVRRSSCASP